jgi:preprotein translocase subunit SecB
MGMKEEYFPKWGIRTVMGNTLDGVTRSGIYPPVNLRPVDFSMLKLFNATV